MTVKARWLKITESDPYDGSYVEAALSKCRTVLMRRSSWKQNKAVALSQEVTRAVWTELVYGRLREELIFNYKVFGCPRIRVFRTKRGVGLTDRRGKVGSRGVRTLDLNWGEVLKIWSLADQGFFDQNRLTG